MSRIKNTFESLKSQNKKALVVYLTAGDPNLEDSVAAALAAIEAGADVLEVGVPFSDPLADGPVIQRAMNRALEAGGGLKERSRWFVGLGQIGCSDYPLWLRQPVDVARAQGEL